MMMTNTQGQEYSTLVAKEMGFDGEAYDGKTMIRLRSNNGDIADLKKQAMDELSAVGVTFPVHAAYYIIAGNSAALDNATVLKQCFTDREHETNVRALGLEVTLLDAVHLDAKHVQGAAGHLLQAGDGTAGGGLAGTGLAHQAQHFGAVDGEVRAVHGLEVGLHEMARVRH